MEVFDVELANLQPDQKLVLCRYHYAMLMAPTVATQATVNYDDLPEKMKHIYEKDCRFDVELLRANAKAAWRAAEFTHKELFATLRFRESDRARCTDSYLANAQAIIVTPKKPLAKLLTIGSPEGKGGYGTVHNAVYKPTKKKVAVKQLRNETEREKKANLQEIAFLVKFQHPNIMDVIGVFLDPKSPLMMIVLEYMDGGSVSLCLGRLSSNAIAYVVRCILEALEYMHKQQIGHCDIKPDNVMLKFTGEVKLVDYGLCSEFFSGPRRAMKGSPFWLPPEMVRGNLYGLGIDIWALGVVTLEIFVLRLPWKNPTEHLFNIATVGLIPSIHSSIQGDEKDFLVSCLDQDPDTRPTAAELLRHSFVQNTISPSQFIDQCQEVFVAKQLEGVKL